MRDPRITQKINDLIVECAAKRIAIIVALKEPDEEPTVAGCGSTFNLAALGSYVLNFARDKMRVEKGEGLQG